MFTINDIFSWMERRKIRKEQKIYEDNLLFLNLLTVTYHGRMQLMSLITDYDNGIRPEIRRMYWVLLQDAPVREYAETN